MNDAINQSLPDAERILFELDVEDNMIKVYTGELKNG